MRDKTSIRRRISAVRLRAALATGLVLGVTATLTLAAWHEPEYTSAAFTASTFATESNVWGTGYANNGTTPGPIVVFPGAGFTPGVSAYFPVLIRTTTLSVPGTTILGGALLGGPDAATLGVALTYRVVRTTAACDATAFTGAPYFVVGAATSYRALTAGQESGVSNPLAGATASLPGTATGFCFEITLPAGSDGSLQAKTATATWQFVSLSN